MDPATIGEAAGMQSCQMVLTSSSRRTMNGLSCRGPEPPDAAQSLWRGPILPVRGVTPWTGFGRGVPGPRGIAVRRHAPAHRPHGGGGSDVYRGTPGRLPPNVRTRDSEGRTSPPRVPGFLLARRGRPDESPTRGRGPFAPRDSREALSPGQRARRRLQPRVRRDADRAGGIRQGEAERRSTDATLPARRNVPRNRDAGTCRAHRRGGRLRGRGPTRRDLPVPRLGGEQGDAGNPRRAIPRMRSARDFPRGVARGGGGGRKYGHALLWRDHGRAVTRERR